MDAAAWLTEFAQREARLDAWRAAAALRHQLMGDRIRRELHPEPQVRRTGWAAAVVLEPGREIDSESVGCPAAAGRTAAAALAAGWATRIVRSVAAVPRTGILEVITVRGARHDERFWAGWWNGKFECAQYWGPTAGIEVLGWRTVKARRGVMDALEGRRRG